MKKFKLMQVIPELNSGGVEQGTIDLANYLANLEYNNLIVSKGGKMLPFLNKKKINHYNLPVNSKNFLKMPFVAKKINKLISENNIDILHLRSRAPAWLLPYIDKNKIKTVSTFHNVYGHQNIFKKLYNKQLSKVDHIIAISKYVKDEISKIYNINSDKIRVINRGSDVDFFKPSIDNKEKFSNFLDKNNIDFEKKIILYPGRLTEWKGQLEFLDIVKFFKNEPIIFYFVGDTKNKSFLEKIIYRINKYKLNENCRILGHFNKDELKMIYQCSDIIISSPNKPEGFGRVISEGLLMKKLVLAYNFGGAKEQIEGLSSIHKVNPLDIEDLKIKIKTSLQLGEQEVENIGNAARNKIINNFSNDLMLKSYKNFYEEIQI